MEFDLNSLAEAIKPSRVVDCFGIPGHPIGELFELFVTHYHYDHVPFLRGARPSLPAHLSQAKSLGAMELFAPPTIINRYRQIGLNPVWEKDEDKKRLELPHPDCNNGRPGVTIKSTSYLINPEVFWVAETDGESLLSGRVKSFIEQLEATEAKWVAVPPPDDTHFLSRQAVNVFVDNVRKTGMQPFTYAHAFPGTKKWDSITMLTDPTTGIGVSSATPVGVPMLPQVTETFQDILGGRYSAPGTARR